MLPATPVFAVPREICKAPDTFDTGCSEEKPPFRQQQWHADTPEELLLAEELQDCIKHNLTNLPENQLAALKMRDAGGLSMDDLSNILDVSPSNVRVLLHRGRDKMLQVIDHFQQTGEC